MSDLSPKYLGTGAAACRLHLTRTRLLYLLDKGLVPEPVHQIPGRRLFGNDDIERILAVLTAQPNLRGPAETERGSTCPDR
jgi:hypothetical protein